MLVRSNKSFLLSGNKLISKAFVMKETEAIFWTINKSVSAQPQTTCDLGLLDFTYRLMFLLYFSRADENFLVLLRDNNRWRSAKVCINHFYPHFLSSDAF